MANNAARCNADQGAMLRPSGVGRERRTGLVETATGQDRLGAARAFDELVVRVEPIVRIQARIVIATQTSLHDIGKLAGDEDGWL